MEHQGPQSLHPIQPQRRRTDRGNWRKPFNVRSTLTGKIESLGREIASVQRVRGITGQESHEYAKVRELDELHKNIEHLRRRVEARDSEATNPSLLWKA